MNDQSCVNLVSSELKSALVFQASYTGNNTSIEPKDNSSEIIQLFFSKQLLVHKADVKQRNVCKNSSMKHFRNLEAMEVLTAQFHVRTEIYREDVSKCLCLLN